MNREIEFRGKRTDNLEWIYGYLTKDEKFYITKDADKFYQVIPETIGQYTGLKDKNDKKIFEGDILDFNDQDFNGNDHFYKGFVKYYENYAGFLIDVNEDLAFELGYIVLNDDECEVIGTIFDNK